MRSFCVRKSTLEKKEINTDLTRSLAWYKNEIFNNRTQCEPFTVEDILKVVNSLDKHKSPKIIIQRTYSLKNEIAPILENIYNDWINLSHFPEYYKIAKIIMIPKKKNTNKISEFRPISLLPTIGKIFEILVANRINIWVESNHILNNEQSGFRKNRSTIDHLFQFSQMYTECKNRKRIMQAIFLIKAFDKINHTYLLYKLHKLNFPPYLLNIIKSYITNRQYFIIHEQFQSQYSILKAGVPQGSCLSPILFGLYVCDIPKDQTCKLSQFADDIAIYVLNNKKKHKKLQDYANRIVDWCEKWGLKLNINKTKHMVLGNQKQKLDIFIKDQKLENTDHMKFLGITIDKRMTLKNHIEDTINKCTPAIALINKLKNSYKIPKKKLITLIYTNIQIINTQQIGIWTLPTTYIT